MLPSVTNVSNMAAEPNFPKPSEADLNDFLSKVDEIENVIKGLNSEDENQRATFMSKADKLIEKVTADQKKKEEQEKKKTKNEDDEAPLLPTGFSKTSINKDAYKNEPEQPVIPGGVPMQQDAPVDQAAFMAAMEADAKERAERRKEKEKVGAVFKEQGNAEFKQGNYEKALEFYNQAIDQVRDSSALYTNRAQTHIKLGNYKEALSDCDWALRAWPNCMKAYVHQGHAYLQLKEFDKARESYEQILTIDSKKEALVKDYLEEVDRVEAATQAETKAAQLFEAGDDLVKNVVDLLTRVNKKDQLPLYYAGGFRVIAPLLDNVDTQTLFRSHHGLTLPTEHPVLSRCLRSPITSLSKEERDVIAAALDMLTAACKDNETNQQQLIKLPGFASQLIAVLEVKLRGQGRMLRTSCLNLLFEISTTHAGQVAIVNNFDLIRLISALFPLMTKAATYAGSAAAIFNNIALDKRVKTALRDTIEESILPAFEKLLNNNKTTASIAGLAASTATNLANDVTIRKKMAARPNLWNIASRLLTNYTEARLVGPLEALLGLLMNLSTGVEPSSLQNVPKELFSACYTIIQADTISDTSTCRALALLSNILVHSGTELLSEEEKILVLLEYMKNSDPAKSKSALKCLVTLTRDSEHVRQILADNKATSVLLSLLNSSDETTQGNAALCMSHLCSVQKVCAKLTKTNIIQKLLTLARDARNTSVQSNCAILIGKLVQGDERHHQKLTELQGFQILHNCMKYVKS